MHWHMSKILDTDFQYATEEHMSETLCSSLTINLKMMKKGTRIQLGKWMVNLFVLFISVILKWQHLQTLDLFPSAEDKISVELWWITSSAGWITSAVPLLTTNFKRYKSAASCNARHISQHTFWFNLCSTVPNLYVTAPTNNGQTNSNARMAVISVGRNCKFCTCKVFFCNVLKTVFFLLFSFVFCFIGGGENKRQPQAQLPKICRHITWRIFLQKGLFFFWKFWLCKYCDWH